MGNGWEYKCEKCNEEYSFFKEDLHCPKYNGLLKDVGRLFWD